MVGVLRRIDDEDKKKEKKSLMARQSGTLREKRRSRVDCDK